MGIKLDPVREQMALIDAQQLLMIIAKHGNISPEKIMIWAKEILDYYPNQNVIEEVWKDRVLEAIITQIKGGS